MREISQNLSMRDSSLIKKKVTRGSLNSFHRIIVFFSGYGLLNCHRDYLREKTPHKRLNEHWKQTRSVNTRPKLVTASTEKGSEVIDEESVDGGRKIKKAISI